MINPLQDASEIISALLAPDDVTDADHARARAWLDWYAETMRWVERDQGASLIKDNPAYAPPAEATVPAPPAESRVPLKYLRPAQNWWMVAAVAREVDRQHRGGQPARIDDDDLLDMVVRALLRFAKDRKAAMAARSEGEGS